VPGDHRVFPGRGGQEARRLSGTTIGPVNRAYSSSIRALQVMQVVIGLALIVSALAKGGGPLALGVILGVILVLLGAGRLWIARRQEQ